VGQWADREIARRCHVDHVTVSRLRSEIAPKQSASGENHQTDDSEEKRTYTRKGKTHKQKKGKRGKAAQQREPEHQPSNEELEAAEKRRRDAAETERRKLFSVSIIQVLETYARTDVTPHLARALIRVAASQTSRCGLNLGPSSQPNAQRR
jgi:hypothetical protein